MSTWISEWNPEDPVFWERTGKSVARRNLIWSIIAENIGFSVWLLWSVVVPRLPKAGFHYTEGELLSLLSLPALVGAVMRFPYTFAVPKFGGRNWTVVSALLLLIPTCLLVVLVSRPDTPYWMMAAAAATAGFGGGNFASSMANISFFYPDKKKGLALGLNAAGGNIGVSNVQLLVPIVIGIGAMPGTIRLQNAGILFLPLIGIAAIGAFFFMNNLTSARSNFGDQVAVARRHHTWVMAFLYIGTFGSFVGYSFAFPFLLKRQFPEVTANLAFLGALVGSVARPLGGYLADKLGGSRVTFWNFVAVAGAAVATVWALHVKDFSLFLLSYLVLFVTTGIGNGSTYRMIPVIFRTENTRGIRASDEEGMAEALRAARREAAAAIGLIAGIGALGGSMITSGFKASIAATGGPELAFWCFVAFYLACATTTWWFYTRTTFLIRLAPSLAQAKA
jgi:NNP family nitrate/nitrite transporter-like MFS transporter